MDKYEDPGTPSTAAIGRYPVHPMVVPLPIGFLVGALLRDLAYWGSADLFWARASVWLVGAGIVGGLIAAVAGFADFLGSSRVRTHHHAWYHLFGNATALLPAVVSLVLRMSNDTAAVTLPWGIVLSAVVVALLVFTGWHSGEMVFGQGVRGEFTQGWEIAHWAAAGSDDTILN